MASRMVESGCAVSVSRHCVADFRQYPGTLHTVLILRVRLEKWVVFKTHMASQSAIV